MFSSMLIVHGVGDINGSIWFFQRSGSTHHSSLKAIPRRIRFADLIYLFGGSVTSPKAVVAAMSTASNSLVTCKKCDETPLA